VAAAVDGALTDATGLPLSGAKGSFGPAFLLAAGVAFLGSLGSLLLRPPRTAQSSGNQASPHFLIADSLISCLIRSQGASP